MAPQQNPKMFTTIRMIGTSQAIVEVHSDGSNRSSEVIEFIEHVATVEQDDSYSTDSAIPLNSLRKCESRKSLHMEISMPGPSSASNPLDEVIYENIKEPPQQESPLKLDTVSDIEEGRADSNQANFQMAKTIRCKLCRKRGDPSKEQFTNYCHCNDSNLVHHACLMKYTGGVKYRCSVCADRSLRPLNQITSVWVKNWKVILRKFIIMTLSLIVTYVILVYYCNKWQH